MRRKNSDKFSEKIKQYSGHVPTDIQFLERWFSSTIKILANIHEQQSGLKNPRHRGDARENSLYDVLRYLIPPQFIISKGYAVNKFSTMSSEQDLLIVDSRLSSALIMGGSVAHYPIESILASIQVKSLLTPKEVQNALLSCASLKRVTRNIFSERQEQKLEILYAIFAYKAAKNLDDLAASINELCKNTPPHLRPNVVYVLGEGALIPSLDKSFVLSPSQFFSQGEFSPLKNMGSKCLTGNRAL